MSSDVHKAQDRKRAQPVLRLNTWLLPILVIVLLGLELIVPYRGWEILLIGLGGALLVSYLWVRGLGNGLKLTREMRFGWAQVGDRIEERFKLSNDSFLPAPMVELIDHSTMPGYEVGRLTHVGAQDLIRWRKDAVCTRRGVYNLGPSTLLTGDPLGVFSLTVHYPASAPFVVLPPIVPLPDIQVEPGGRGNEGRYRTTARHQTVSAASVREYVSGDSLRWIHWPTSARQNSLYVRLFDGMPAGDWWIVLDTDEQVQVGRGEASTHEHSVILAASLADMGLQSRRAVGLVTTDQDLTWIPPHRGAAQRWEILRSLAKASLGTTPLSEVLTEIGSAVAPYDSLVIVTPSVSGSWVEELILLLRRGVAPTVLLLDPKSYGANQDMEGIAALLSGLEVTHYVITRDYLDRADTRPGQQGRMEWHVLSTGHVVPKHPLPDVAWRKLE